MIGRSCSAALQSLQPGRCLSLLAEGCSPPHCPLLGRDCVHLQLQSLSGTQAGLTPQSPALSLVQILPDTVF